MERAIETKHERKQRKELHVEENIEISGQHRHSTLRCENVSSLYSPDDSSVSKPSHYFWTLIILEILNIYSQHYLHCER